jgi:hypothetical protein
MERYTGQVETLGAVMSITPDQYKAAIPTCCSYRTYEEHVDGLMLCWGLVLAIEQNIPMDCSGCELAVDPNT